KFLSLGVTIVVPTLAYALVLLIVLSWLFAGLTFFIDRYRVPVLVLLLIVGITTTQSRASDYYYELVPQVPGTAAAPATVLNAPDQSSVIVVAANGGGIQSAAWTARVLTGLELQARKEFGPDYRGFGKSIRLVSSVSGGSVGAMYVLNGYSPDGLPADDELARIVAQAETSSLDDVAWGIAYPDTVRTVLPFRIVSRILPIDRGRALEAAWNRDRTLGVPLSSWREDVRAGWRPAAVFNATIADTGERLLFSTSGLNHLPFRGQLFEQAYPGKDVSVVTAARLSATFPYVTPAARAQTSDDLPQFHVVDGGYYDNYGMATLTEWLDQALNGSQGAIKKVLVLQIRGAPGGTDPIYRFEGDEQCPQRSDPRLTKGTRRGWFYQMYAPMSTLLNVRDTGQLAHNDVEFKLLQQLWQQRGVQIESAVFQYPGANTPLSWHLTAEQKQDIERYWAAELAGCQQQQSWATVKQFLQGVNQPVAGN
ncbi:MAG: patatin-like phospholipase family protein, partial [Chloroflexi bacterium]|nr:patatin-like phospholipase family protein [Chloroflexota bacterium]